MSTSRFGFIFVFFFLVAAGARAAGDGPPNGSAANDGKAKAFLSDSAAVPLPPGAVARLGTPPPRHDGPIRFCAFTPDGRAFVSQAADGVRVWDAATARELRHLAGKPGVSVRAAALSADGKRVATLDDAKGGSVSIWEVETGRLVRELASPPRPSVWPVLRFSPDGKKVAGIAGLGPEIYVWDADSGKRLLSWDGAAQRVWDIAFTADGAGLISGGDDKVIHVWDARTGKAVRELSGDLDEVGRLALSPDGTLLASVGQHFEPAKGGYWHTDDTVQLWDMATGKVTRRLAMPAGLTYRDAAAGACALAFAADGKRLLTGGPDREVRVWNTTTGVAEREVHDRAGCPGLLALSPDGKRLAVAPQGSEVFAYPLRRGRVLFTEFEYRNVPSDWFQFFDLESGAELARPAGHAAGVSICSLSPDGRLVATASAGPEIIVWDLAAAREQTRLVGHAGDVVALGWAADGREVLSAAADQALRRWDATSGKQLNKVAVRGTLRLDGPAGAHAKASFSADGKYLAIVDQEGGIVVTDVATGKEVQSFGVRSGNADGLAFSPDGQTLGINTTESAFHSWSLASGKEAGYSVVRDIVLAPYYLYHRPSGFAQTADGKVLVAGRLDGSLTMIDFPSMRVLRMLFRRNFGDARVALSPDGRTLAWGGTRVDPAVVLYEVATGQERLRLTDRPQRTLALQFTGNGRRLLTGLEDGTTLVWDLTLRAPGDKPAPLAAADLDRFWADLAGKDGVRAYRAERALVNGPGEAVPFLRKALAPATPPTEEHVTQLIAELNSDREEDRTRALGELDAIGEPAFPMVLRTLQNRPTETARDPLQQLSMWHFRESREPSPSRTRELRTLEILELIGTPEARKVVEELAAGDPDARRTQWAKAILARMPARSP